jgi:3-oxoisoapionate decarboxylase
MDRRQFLATTAAAAAAYATPSRAASATRPLIGLDHFALRATGWKAGDFVDHAAALKLDAVFISELGPFESFEDAYLKQLKEKADRANLKFYVGSSSICKTSNTWKDTWGSPEEHLALIIRLAKALGSPVARCYLGNAKDRSMDGGIDRHIEECVKVLKQAKSLCEAEGIKVAMENHAGDMQSHELRALIEAAGKDYVGANIDPGNAVWALEDPLDNLEVLGPYTLCSSIRDSVIWESEAGATVQWTAVGDGLVDFKAYAKRFAELAPSAPLHVETISGFNRPFPFLTEEFWKPYPKASAASFAKWVAMAKRGKPLEPFKAPANSDKKEAEITYQKDQLARSTKWLQDNL